MDEEFESFVVTNPDLVDEGIDISGLRTNTDASILGNIPDYGGIQYEAYNPNRLSDLMRLYSSGLPTIATDAAQIPGAVDPLVDVGGGGGPTLPYIDVDSPKNTPFVDLVDPNVNIDEVALTGGLTDAPAGGADMGTVPTDADVAFQDMGDADVGVELLDPTQYVGNLDDYDNLDDYNAALANAQGLTGPTVLDAPEVSQTLQDQGPTTVDFSTGEMLDANAQDIGNIYDEVALTGDTPSFAPEQQGLIDQAFSKVGSTAENIMDDLSKIPGAVANFAEQTVDVFGKKINVGKTLLNAGINRLAGGPVSLIVDALGAIKPDKYDQEAQGALGEIDMLKTTEGGLTTDKYGINVQSAFGDYDDYNLERQIDLQEKVDDGTLQQYNEDGTLTYLGKELEDRKTIEQQLNETRLGEAKQEQQDFVQEIEAQPVVQAVSEAARDQQRDTGVASVSTGIGGKGLGGYQTSSGDVYASAAEAAEKGDGGGGGGKIVCTMMNNSYGFGSFRNKIWLKHSRDMAPEYQKGYHKIFLPLVKLSKTNKVLKKILEHIAVHRTIDIRQEARGKMHLLGRVYRKILEPICYIVGKYAKR